MYSIDGVNFQNNNIFSGLAAGSYQITLRDALGFTTNSSIVVVKSCINVSAAAGNSTCGNSNGTITTTVTNGMGPYVYSIDGVNFQSTNNFSGLSEGSYTVTVKDFNGQVGTAIVSVANIPGPQISLTVLPVSCERNDGSVQISGTGGTLPFSYSIDGTNFQTSNLFPGLLFGSYTAFIKDLNGCIASQAFNIGIDCPTVVVKTNDETCNTKNASFTITILNGTPPFQFSLDGNNFQTGNFFSGLHSGSHTIIIEDGIGISFTYLVLIGNVCPVITAVSTDGLCGVANGSIKASGSNGTEPYQYSIDGINFQTNNTFIGLVAGTYTITMKDANGLTNQTTSVVNNFPAPQIIVSGTASSCLNNNGSININATSGTSPFEYSIDGINFQNNNLFKGLASGNYTGAVKDSKGCVVTNPVVVSLNNDLVLSMNNDTTICEGSFASLKPLSNGSTFSWTPSTTLKNANSLVTDASPVSSSKYYLTAKLGVCSTLDSTMVFVNPAPIGLAGNDTTICFGQSVQLNGSGGVNYSWSPSTYLNINSIQNPFVSKPASSITYNLHVTDLNNCGSISPATVTIHVTPPAKVFAGNDTSIAIGETLHLHATDINNNGFVQYSWSPSIGLDNAASSNPVFIGTNNITYSVIATTPAGCQGNDQIIVKVYNGPEIYVPKAFTPNNDGLNDLLKPIPIGIKEFKYFVVYNRWGRKVFFTTDPSKGWDGKINNVALDVNTFVWISEGVDYKGNVVQRKGTVTLVR